MSAGFLVGGGRSVCIYHLLVASPDDYRWNSRRRVDGFVATTTVLRSGRGSKEVLLSFQLLENVQDTVDDTFATIAWLTKALG